jgi:hypothetical protein
MGSLVYRIQVFTCEQGENAAGRNNEVMAKNRLCLRRKFAGVWEIAAPQRYLRPLHVNMDTIT